MLAFSKMGSTMHEVQLPRRKVEAKVRCEGQLQIRKRDFGFWIQIERTGGRSYPFIATSWVSYFPFRISVLRSTVCQRNF